MIKLVLDGGEIHSRAVLHDVLARGLDLPSHYGRNLDALFDCLTDFSQDVEISLLHYDVLEAHLGPYAHNLAVLLRRAAAENPHVTCSGGQ